MKQRMLKASLYIMPVWGICFLAAGNAYCQIHDTFSTGFKNLVQPFSLILNHYDLHVMLNFNKHPEYKAVEAMIDFRNNDKPLVRAVTIRHDETKVDYVNDSILIERIRMNLIFKRTICYTPIEFIRKEIKGIYQLSLKFTTLKNEKIDFYLETAGTPSAKYGGLAEPGNALKNVALPVVLTEKNALAGANSRITINGTRYAIPVKVYIPVFFTGLEGYYSENFSLGLFFIKNRGWTITRAPDSIAIGEEWVITDSEEVRYKIVGNENGRTRIQNTVRHELVAFENNKNGLSIESVAVSSDSAGKRTLAIRFSPPLKQPADMTDREKLSSRFSITMNNSILAIQGRAEMTRDGETISITVIPEKPKWARASIIRARIHETSDKQYEIKSTVGSVKGQE